MNNLDSQAWWISWTGRTDYDEQSGLDHDCSFIIISPQSYDSVPRVCPVLTHWAIGKVWMWCYIIGGVFLVVRVLSQVDEPPQCTHSILSPDDKQVCSHGSYEGRGEVLILGYDTSNVRDLSVPAVRCWSCGLPCCSWSFTAPPNHNQHPTQQSTGWTARYKPWMVSELFHGNNYEWHSLGGVLFQLIEAIQLNGFIKLSFEIFASLLYGPFPQGTLIA